VSAPRSLTLPADPIERVRALMLLPALGACVAGVVAAFGSPHAVALRLVCAAAAAALGGYWLSGYRRRAFPLTGEAPEALAMFLVVLGAPAGFPLPMFGTGFRAMFGGRLTAAARVLVWMTGVGVAARIQGPVELGDLLLGKTAGLLVGALLIQLLGRTFARLRSSEARLRAVLERSTDVVTVVGPDRRISWQAASIRNVLGHDPDRLHGTPVVELFHPVDAPTIERLLDTVAPGAAETVVVRIADTGGKYHEMEVVVGNRTQDASVGGFLLSMRDVTARRRLDREREALRAQRQRQELEARLQRAQRLESVGQLAGGVAHDFNNLLAAILNYTAIVREDLEPAAPAQEDLAEIEDAARRGARLVQQLLLFSQGKLTTPEVVDLNDVVRRLDRLLQRTLGDQVRLEYQLDPALQAVEADVTNVEQVLVNLVVNARDALGAEGGTVTVRTTNDELAPAAATDLDAVAGAYVRLSVSDDGCGMDERTLERALEPFFTTKPVGEGSGLGLATVHGIVRQAGGCVDLDSRPGRGTTVIVRLPPARV
jgi:PAS domain S-box-containing protein